jgi:hypothetical protein
VRLDQVDDPLLDVRPDRGAPLLARRRALQVDPAGRAELAHVLHGHDDAQVPLLGRRRRHHLHRLDAAEEAGDLLDRPDGRGEPDALGGPLQQLVEPFERQGQVGTALRPGDCVDLVDDDRLDAAQRLTSLGGQHQEQRLRGRDQDVGRRRGDAAALVGRCVTGADADGDVRLGGAEPGRGVPDPRQRGAEVALDVDRESLERRHVEHPAAALPVLGRCRGGQPVERPQKGAQRLAGPGGSDHQRVAAGRDRGPGADLRRRGRGEGGLEPGPGGLAEPFPHLCLGHVAILSHATDNPRPATGRATMPRKPG